MYLNCKTYYSFKYGTFSTEELVKTAVDNGVTALALTNINSTCDAWEFVKLCGQEGIKPIVGVEVRQLQTGSVAERRNEEETGKRSAEPGNIKTASTVLYILIAASNRGLARIHSFISDHLIDKKHFPEKWEEPFFNEWKDGFVIYPLGAKPFTELLPNERVGLLPWELGKLYGSGWKNHTDKFVIRHPVTIQNKKYHSLHRLMRAIDRNVLLSKLPKEEEALPEEVFVPPSVLLEQFKQYPFLVTNTYQLMDACRIGMDFASDKTMCKYGGSKEDDRILLEKLAKDGLVNRYGPKKNTERYKTAAARLSKELKIINDLGFNSYFLINLDIVRYAQSRGFYHVGRGSGANSIVAYCLGITDVDPIELNLFFERFLNPHRTSPPDFDIDFSWTDRDEIIDYVFKRYGKDYVSLLGAYTTFKGDSIIRELGKVFGLPDEEIKTLQRTQRAEDKIGQLILQYGKLLYGFPNNISIHACGMLITEKPIREYVSLYMPPKGFPTAQIDMFVAEDIGINKFDILSQRGLGHIREALRLIKENTGNHVNIHDFENFRKDPAICKQIREANTIGCFYIESPAMRQLLKKLRCDDYITLVAASSIIRPGVAQSGMMREYIYRYHNPHDIKYLHPLFEEHLSETFGVMVFQEDVIKIAHYFAGLDLGEADILRRAMSGKYRSHNQFRMIQEKFFAKCKLKGHPDELAAEVWRQMESFAGYSFNKAHSASFAVESYMSLYLKTYYPKEFMVAVINNFGGFYSRELYFLELLKCGGRLRPPCVNTSFEYTCIQGDEVYAGFIHVKGLQSKLVETIIDERSKNGPYLHLQDFIERTNTGLEQLNKLVSIGAFRFTGKSKKRLLWEANFLQKNNQPLLHGSQPLFEEAPVEFHLPNLDDKPLDDLYDEMELMGFTLSNPFDMVDDDPVNYVYAKDMDQHKGKNITMLAYFIARKHVVTKHHDQMFFGTFVDANLDWIDTVHFPDTAEKYPLHTGGFYKITGKVVEDFGVYSLEVMKMYTVGYKPRRYENLGSSLQPGNEHG
jgi:DNA polymerase-3 subunit alpha